MPIVPDSITGQQTAPNETWQDRLREAAYTAPSGTRIRFDYEDVGRSFEKRTALFEFPGVDDGYVQDNGIGPRKYPLRCYFWGPNHDRIATAFEAALAERGHGKLEHPLYGTPTVVPFGEIGRRDDLKTAANQTIIDVTFFTTVGAVYPSSQANPRSEILAALDGFDVAAAQQFDDAMVLTTVASKAKSVSTIRGFLLAVSAELSFVSETVSSVNREFRDAQQEINLGLDVLIGQPLQLAQQISNLIQAPARATAGIVSRLEGYQRLAMRIIESTAGASSGLDGTPLKSLRQTLSNDFHTSDLFAMSAVSGSVLSVVENTFATKPDALSAAAAVLAQLDQVVVWREPRFEGLGQVDPGGSYQALQHAAALVAGYLIETSFSLALERSIVLDRPRTIIDLSAELYGSIENERLDFLISSNDLSGSEILELPRGRVVKYYP